MNWKLSIGWLGMIMLQFNSIPAIYAAIETGQKFPVATILLTIGGLVCYNIRAIAQRDMLYIVGNSIGIFGNGVLLCLTI